MRKNAQKYLAFESLYSSRQRLYLSNSIFLKNYIEQIFSNVRKYNFLTLKNKFAQYNF